MSPFETASYLAQVRRLRVLAEKALAEFPIRVRVLEFIQHGENATFKVTDVKGRHCLLRIHRLDYHSLAGIEEELAWLESMDGIDVAIPRPVRTKDGRRLTTVSTDGITNARPVTMLDWTDGRGLFDAVRTKHMTELGRTIAKIQKATGRRKSKHRNYWNPDSMLGTKPKWGAFDDLPGVRTKVQDRITSARITLLKELKSFEKKHPDRMTLIHSDMHFGNLIRTKSGWGVIDFDDCGYGFRAYDLNAPMMSVHYTLKDQKRTKEIDAYKNAMIEGYNEIMPWDADDSHLLDRFMAVRSLIILGWLNSRSDNPRLKARLKAAVKRTQVILDASEL